MELSMDAVAGKMVAVIAGLSVVVAGLGVLAIMHLSGNDDATVLASVMGVRAGHVSFADFVPFATGVGAATALNIAKVMLMKRAVNAAVKREASAAQFYLKQQYFIRLVLTAAVFFVAGFLHSGSTTESGNPALINFMGVFFGIFTFPIATHSMRFFLRDALKDEIIESSKEPEKNAVQDAIEKLNAIGTGEIAEDHDEPTDENKAE